MISFETKYQYHTNIGIQDSVCVCASANQCEKRGPKVPQINIATLNITTNSIYLRWPNPIESAEWESLILYQKKKEWESLIRVTMYFNKKGISSYIYSFKKKKKHLYVSKFS